MTNLEFSIANNAVTHLGRNLYSTTPPALAELVANSYDAYATDVTINLSSESIVVVDNGKGLSLEELRDKYAVIGSQKQDEVPINGLSERKPMGKKGIGKLAAFSLGSEYTVYSKSRDNDTWLSFSLHYSDMIDSENYTVNVKSTGLPKEFGRYNTYESGFIVKITGIRRKITEATKNSIKKQLSRRFYIDQSRNSFSVKMDGETLILDSNSYYDNIEYMIYFGEKELLDRFPNCAKKELYTDNENLRQYFSKIKVHGWIGTVKRPRNLKNSDGASFANIIVFANNKIADEDILKSKPSARIANNYIVGEIFADSFVNSLTDPITSSRQGLDDSIEEIGEFIENIAKVRNYVIEKWDEIRQENAVENLPERIQKNISYQEWLSNLSSSQKKLNNRLLNLLSTELDSDTEINSNDVDSMVTSISTVINNIETDELLKKFNDEDDSNIQKNLLISLMGNIAKTEDLNHVNLIKKRLAAIEKLERLMRDGSVPEKVFEEHLSDNPWLIKPYWNIDRNSLSNVDSLSNQVFFKLDRGDNDFKRNFLDILIRVAEEKYPIIVELKKNTPKGHAKVNYSKIYDQVTNYRLALIQNIPELKEIKPEDIKVVFILSEDTGTRGSGHTIELSELEIKNLESFNIEILKYNKMLLEAKKMYKDHIEYQNNANLVPNLKITN